MHPIMVISFTVPVVGLVQPSITSARPYARLPPRQTLKTQCIDVLAANVNENLHHGQHKTTQYTEDEYLVLLL